MKDGTEALGDVAPAAFVGTGGVEGFVGRVLDSSFGCLKSVLKDDDVEVWKVVDVDLQCMPSY